MLMIAEKGADHVLGRKLPRAEATEKFAATSCRRS